MARKKSKGSKKSRAKKTRKPKSTSTAAVESGESAVATDDVAASEPDASSGSAPAEDSPSSSARKSTGDKPTTAKKGAKKKSRKKASGKKKSPAKKPEPEPVEVIDLDEVDVEVIDLDDEEADLDALVAAAVGEDESVSIDLEEELDDPEARRRLIEEALAFVAAEESGEAPVAALDDPDDRDDARDPSEPRTTDTQDGADPGTPAPVADGEAGSDGGETPPKTPERPRLGAEALLALSEFRAEGLASLPEELVLDLGEASTPEERDRLLAAALVHVEMQDAIYRIPVEELRSRRIKTGIAAALFFVAALVAMNPPGFIVPTPPPALTEADRRQGVLVALTLQAQQVEAFQVANGRLPRSIGEVERSIPGIRFVRSTNRVYQLIAYGPDGEPIVYDSSTPTADFQRLWRNWSTTANDDFGGLR